MQLGRLGIANAIGTGMNVSSYTHCVVCQSRFEDSLDSRWDAMRCDAMPRPDADSTHIAMQSYHCVSLSHLPEHLELPIAMSLHCNSEELLLVPTLLVLDIFGSSICERVYLTH